MDLSIIIVSWRVKDKLKENLQAIFSSNINFSFEVFVVDNNSGDGSVEMIRRDFPLVKLINNCDNLGFAKANNQALKEASGDYILLLNPDMLVQENTLFEALRWAKNNQQATVSGFKLINHQGEVIKQVRNFPKTFDQLMIIFKIPHLFPKVLNNYIPSNFNYERAARVDSVRGAFFLINAKNYQSISGKKPLLDERYFIWFEEVDFCREIYSLGAEVWYSPAASCLDYIGASFSQVRRGQTQKYFRDSMLAYFSKWEKKSSYLILKLAWGLIGFFIRQK